MNLVELRAQLAHMIEGMDLGPPWSQRIRVSAFPTAQVTPPMVIIGVPAVEFDQSKLGDEHSLVWEVWAVCGQPTERSTWELFDRFASTDAPGSLHALIDGDPTLGGLVNWATVTAVEPDPVVVSSGVNLVAALATITISTD